MATITAAKLPKQANAGEDACGFCRRAVRAARAPGFDWKAFDYQTWAAGVVAEESDDRVQKVNLGAAICAL